VRRKNSERRLDEVVREDQRDEDEKGILEIFPRDEDEPLSRDGEDEEDGE
jgi:hypothetical protein